MSRIASGTFLFLFLFPAVSGGESLDRRIVEQIHTRWQGKFTTQVMEKTTLLGDARIQLGICLLLSTYGSEKQKEMGKLSFTSLALAGTAVGGIKYAVGRERPYERTSRTNSSFPSGHSAAAFAVSSVMASEYPKLKLPAYGLAAAVAFSRVYLGKHYPSDVVVGAAIGYAAGKIVYSKRKAVLSLNF